MDYLTSSVDYFIGITVYDMFESSEFSLIASQNSLKLIVYQSVNLYGRFLSFLLFSLSWLSTSTINA